jgi:hypothetical protein
MKPHNQSGPALQSVSVLPMESHASGILATATRVVVALEFVISGEHKTRGAAMDLHRLCRIGIWFVIGN